MGVATKFAPVMVTRYSPNRMSGKTGGSNEAVALIGPPNPGMRRVGLAGAKGSCGGTMNGERSRGRVRGADGGG